MADKLNNRVCAGLVISQESAAAASQFDFSIIDPFSLMFANSNENLPTEERDGEGTLGYGLAS